MPPPASALPREHPAPARPALLSPQVSAPTSRYFFLNPGAPSARRARASRPHAKATLAFGGLEHCNPDYLIDRPAFAYHVIEFIVEGSGTVQLGRKPGGVKHSIGPGSVFLCEKHTRCLIGVDPAQPFIKYFLCLTGSGMPLARLRRAGLHDNRVHTLTAQGEARSVLEDIIREGRRPGPRAVEICNVLFELLCLKIAESLSPSSSSRERPKKTPARANVRFASRTPASLETFLRCKAIIDEHAEHLSTLAEISIRARLDASAVCRLFRKHQGVSPYQYLLRRKMNIAAELLVDGGTLIKEAAQRVGFTDPLHFSRVFRAIHGVPPSSLQLRKR